MKITMTVIIERQLAQKGKKNCETFFIYKKQDTSRYAIFHENFEVGIYIPKAWHFALRDVLIYKKPDNLQKARQFALRFYIPLL